MSDTLQPDFHLADGRGYMLDESFAAAGRLNYQFYIWKDTFGFNIHPSIQLPEDAHIADIATGTAIWAIDVARERPTAKIDAVDISLSKVSHPGWLSSNITYREWNMFHEVPEDMVGKYDLVHSRLLVLVVENKDPSPVLRNLKKMLKPNGYIQWDDLNYVDSGVKAVDPSLQIPATHKFLEMIVSKGRNNWTSRLHEFAKEVGFGSAELYKYVHKKDMTVPAMEIYLMTMDEFASRLEANNLDNEATQMRDLCRDTYRETRLGAAIFIPKVVCVAINSQNVTENTTNGVESAWYRKDIGHRLAPAIEKAYLKWTGLSGDALIARLHQIRERAWTCSPYPCVGQWMFLMPSITAFPEYPSILAKAQNGAKILDIACCFGQDLRLLASEGVSTENMYASDIASELWNLGYELFDDKDRMKAQFIQADIFDDNSQLHQFNGKMDIITANQFIHLFDWDRQVLALKKIIGFTSGPDAIVVGYQRATEVSRKQPMSWGEMFIHDPQTWQEIWRVVSEETGTKWKLDARLVDLKEWGLEKEDTVWMDEYPKGINFVATRLE